jgi:hypothetical protein
MKTCKERQVVEKHSNLVALNGSFSPKLLAFIQRVGLPSSFQTVSGFMTLYSRRTRLPPTTLYTSHIET